MYKDNDKYYAKYLKYKAKYHNAKLKYQLGGNNTPAGVDEPKEEIFRKKLAHTFDELYPRICVIILEVLCCYQDMMDCKIAKDINAQEYVVALRKEFFLFKNELIEIFNNKYFPLTKNYPHSITEYLNFVPKLLDIYLQVVNRFNAFCQRFYATLKSKNITYYYLESKTYKPMDARLRAFSPDVYNQEKRRTRPLQNANLNDQTDQAVVERSLKILTDYVSASPKTRSEQSYCDNSTKNECYLNITLQLTKITVLENDVFKILTEAHNNYPKLASESQINNIKTKFNQVKEGVISANKSVGDIKNLAIINAQKKGKYDKYVKEVTKAKQARASRFGQSEVTSEDIIAQITKDFKKFCQ